MANALSNLALLLKDTNRLSDAEPLLRRALTIMEASYGEDHPNVGIALMNLAAALRDMNRLSEVKSLGQRAVAITGKTNLLGRPHSVDYGTRIGKMRWG